MERLTSPRYRNYYGGLVLVLIGLGAAFQAQTYQIGTLHDMGAGFFPVALGIILALCGIVLLGSAVAQTVGPEDARGGQPAAPGRSPEWRGWICICLSVIAFAVLGEYTGLVPATLACVSIAAFGDRDNNLRDILLLATGITLAGVVVFWWGLRIAIPLFSANYM